MAAGANPSYGNDYRDACRTERTVADRCNDICLLVMYTICANMPDEDPFKQLSGTNGLTGAADGIHRSRSARSARRERPR